MAPALLALLFMLSSAAPMAADERLAMAATAGAGSIDGLPGGLASSLMQALPPPPITVERVTQRYGTVTIPHKLHLDARVSCKACHGPGQVSTIQFTPQLAHETCIGCHKEREKGPSHCAGCHVKTLEPGKPVLAAAPAAAAAASLPPPSSAATVAAPPPDAAATPVVAAPAPSAAAPAPAGSATPPSAAPDNSTAAAQAATPTPAAGAAPPADAGDGYTWRTFAAQWDPGTEPPTAAVAARAPPPDTGPWNLTSLLTPSRPIGAGTQVFEAGVAGGSGVGLSLRVTSFGERFITTYSFERLTSDQTAFMIGLLGFGVSRTLPNRLSLVAQAVGGFDVEERPQLGLLPALGGRLGLEWWPSPIWKLRAVNLSVTAVALVTVTNAFGHHEGGGRVFATLGVVLPTPGR